MTRSIGIYVFDQVEALDFAGPYEVFTCASRVSGKLWPQSPAPFTVTSIAMDRQPVKARAGLALVPDSDITSAGQPDVLIVPGGVVTAELRNPAVARWIAATAPSCELVASVCTGAFLLAQAGILDGQEATTHWEDIDDLQAMFPAVQVRANRRWVDNGKVITSAGISAGIDMSLHLVERLTSRELAVATARQMEYDWNEG